MRSTQNIFLLAVAACCATAAAAADPAADASSAYKLKMETPDAFRLAAKEANTPPPEPRIEPPISVLLADKPYTELIHHAARQAALDPALVHAVISVESAYNPAARSPKGALGLMQVMPETALRYGVREREAARSPAANLRAGTLYLSDLIRMFDNRLDLALAAYNAGENAVLRYGLRIPPYRETQLYVPAVLARYLQLQEPLATTAAAAAVAPAPTRIQYMQGTGLELDAVSGKQ
jgi:soluble lytic murein transglycosylase-like protein